MPTWTLHFVSCAGLVALLGVVPVSGSVVDVFLFAATACCVCLVGLYGKAAIVAAVPWFRAQRHPHPPTSSSALRGAHA